jgi:hypothetical protein
VSVVNGATHTQQDDVKSIGRSLKDAADIFTVPARCSSGSAVLCPHSTQPQFHPPAAMPFLGYESKGHFQQNNRDDFQI